MIKTVNANIEPLIKLIALQVFAFLQGIYSLAVNISIILIQKQGIVLSDCHWTGFIFFYEINDVLSSLDFNVALQAPVRFKVKCCISNTISNFARISQKRYLVYDIDMTDW